MSVSRRYAGGIIWRPMGVILIVFLNWTAYYVMNVTIPYQRTAK